MEQSAGERSRATTSVRDDATRVAREWALPFAIGAAALLLDQAIRLPIQLPGHNGVLWMGGLVAARLLSGTGLGASTAGVGALVAAQSSDPLAGFEIAVVGLVMDVVVALRPIATWLWLPLLGAAGNGAVLAMKLATGSAPNAVVTRGLGFAIASYVLYGAIGGAVAGLLPALAARLSRRLASRM